MVFVIVILSLIILAIFCVISAYNKKYEDFIKNHSVTFKNLLQINKSTRFYVGEKNFNLQHIYDNEKYFDTISCTDYLIYQLQFSRYDVEKEIKNLNKNVILYDKYKEKILDIYHPYNYDCIDERLHPQKLQKTERIMIKKLIYPRPNSCLTIRVVLQCATMSGRIYRQKERLFDQSDILPLISRVNNKSGNFYNDREIWESICRVERGKVSNKMRFAIYKRDGYRCCHCGRSEGYDYLEIDHIKPISKGGKSTFDNLQTLCRRCNKEKGNRF